MTAEDKKEYLKWGWLDFLGSLPFIPLLGVLRIFRAIRSLRILRHNNLQELFQVITKRPERTTVFSVLLFTIILVGLSSYTIYRTELSSPSRNILNMSDALWWAIVTITTVGYGDHFPTTNGGRTIAIILMFTGIGIFGALTSYLSTLFINRRNKNIEVNNQQIYERLARIEEQLRNLTIEKENQSDKSDESSP